jgi:hypothetical protein
MTMRIDLPPGLMTDDPDLSGVPFWLWGDNVRFLRGYPETIGLFGNAVDSLADPIVLASTDKPRLWVDDGLTLAAAGDRIALIDLEAGTIVNHTLAGIVSGRWWFDATEDEIIAGKSGLNTVRVIPRDGSAPSVLTNAPAPLGDGIKCGGIVADLLVLAGGVTSFASNPPALLVRWSARRSDPPATVGGAAGFENWTPEPINSSGEILLGSGSRIVGGGACSYGFVVWTDTAMHLLTPRTDLYAFSERKLAGRGLLAQDAWIESEGKVWFFDSTRSLNVFDGGTVRQIPNPIYRATIGGLDPTDAANCSMSTLTRFGEVILNYRDRDGGRRQLIYNYIENVWYNWSLSRAALADEQGVRPALGVGIDGSLYLHEISVLLPEAHTDPLASLSAPSVPSAPTPNIFDVEPIAFDFLLSTSRIPGTDMPWGAARSVEVVVPRVISRGISELSPTGEVFNVTLVGVGENATDATVHADLKLSSLEEEQTSHRVRGKSVRIVVNGTDMKTHVRMGMPDMLLEPVGRR